MLRGVFGLHCIIFTELFEEADLMFVLVRCARSVRKGKEVSSHDLQVMS